jgi:hypothetical protein
MPAHLAPPLPNWLDAPLGALPGHLNAALSQGLRPAEVWAWACKLLSGPCATALDSFTLHAPLEVMARWRLMPLVPDADRPLALLQLLVTAVLAARDKPEAAASAVAPSPAPMAELAQALDAGDVPATTALAVRLLNGTGARRLATPELCHQLAAVVIDRMGASAHAPIGLQLLLRLHAERPADAELARPMLLPLLVDLARTPQRRVVWPSDDAETTSATESPKALISQLAKLQRVPHPAQAGIWPMVQQSIADGAHLPWLRAVQADPHAALASACRVAAWSMLQEPQDEARYGWTHALTLPQAWWALAPEARDAQDRPDQLDGAVNPLAWPPARLAVLHVAAMRRVIGSLRLHPDAPVQENAPSFAALAREACIRADAHGVKYVLACMDAAQASPADTLLYRAAAYRLMADWQASCPEAQILNTLDQR